MGHVDAADAIAKFKLPTRVARAEVVTWLTGTGTHFQTSPRSLLVSTMSMVDKLTKKQRKTLAFRDRKTNKRKDYNASYVGADDNNDVPAMEDQDMADAQRDPLEVEVEEMGSKGKSSIKNSTGKTGPKAKPRDEQAAEGSKKRPREGDETTVQAGQEAKRAKVLDGTRKTDEKNVNKKQRFILFVGMQTIMIFCPLSSHKYTRKPQIHNITRGDTSSFCCLR
jgi:hypothetical protein